MFSKKKLVTVASAPSVGINAQAMFAKAIANPYVGAGGAAFLFMSSALILITLMGDPKAGSPVVRISLAKVAAMAAPPGWREALTADHPGGTTLSTDIFRLSENPLGPGAAFGQAVITVPGRQAFHAADPLPPAPIAGLTAQGSGGLLPIIGTGGKTPAEAYARPFVSNGRPKVGLVIGGLGLNATATRQAIENLPPEITLSFVPYSDGLQGWIDLARQNGHEVLLEAPMEPVDYPDNDPGPYTLMAQAPGQETVKKLEWLLSRATGYFGVTNYLGSRFVGSDGAMTAFTGALRGRGLAFIDDGSAARRGGGLPRASADRIVDDQLSVEAIDQQLLSLEAGALQRGQALGSGFAYPVTLTQVAQWAQSVESRGYQLAPASALTTRR
ncbi:MAG: divergent polysaccharide deacetylase family protein [Phenylobacterium sp.]|uniref:divergent polysaccharide deacetylase family protein n=1 Tax=Phenylobacterium sp. TaxID=1871053 RepID=UPI003BB59532